jgi:pilus assembly protein Flp/PilA
MPMPPSRRVSTHALRALADARAATAVEYGLIVACIVIVMVVSVHGLASVTTTMWNNVSAEVDKAH